MEQSLVWYPVQSKEERAYIVKTNGSLKNLTGYSDVKLSSIRHYM